MPIRMTGMISNLDTDSIVKELMSAQNQKKVKIENKITLNEWKTEKWDSLNTKIKSFYQGILSKVRMQGQYQTKKATSSNEEKMTVTAENEAVNGSYSIKINRLATSQSLTSGKLKDYEKDEDGVKVTKSVTASTKLEDLKGATWKNGDVIHIQNGDKTVDLDVTEYTTVSDFVNACKSAGLTASFDANQKRIFLSSSKTGEDSKFSITTSSITSTEILAQKANLREMFNYETASSATRTQIDSLINQFVEEDWASEAESDIEDKLDKLLDQATTTKYINELNDKWKNNAFDSADSEVKTQMEEAALEAENKYKQECIDKGETADAEKVKSLRDSAAAKVASEYATQKKNEFNQSGGFVAGNPYSEARIELGNQLLNYKMMVANEDGNISNADTDEESNQKLASLGLAAVREGKITLDKKTWKEKGIGFIEAQNSEIEYNDAIINGTTNDIKVNNLTFTLKDVTEGNINVSVSNDTDSIYSMVKEFVKGYNELLKEMNGDYNAKSSRGYDPLTSEQKEAMTEDEVEKWETKIKDSLLRRDDKLSGVISVMRSAMQSSVTVNGKRYSLASFGIGSPDYTEKGLLHIDGDTEDTLTSGNKDKLKKALNEDPEAVVEVFSKVTSNLYDALKSKMKSNTMSSTMTVYNDKQMAKDLTAYKKELEEMEDKLADIEDKYYKQFSAMEVALSKLNSQSNSFSSIAGFN